MRYLLTCMLGLMFFCDSAVAQDNQPSTGVVYTQKTNFRIPYHFDQAEMQRIGAREIRLYVSDDLGQRWQLAQAVPARSGKFLFKSPGDGEYWFSVRTLDSRNQLHPGGREFLPGLRVAVDTTPPELNIQLQQLQENRIQLTWSASDANLDPSQLVLEYKQGGENGWTKVVILPQPEGQTSWTVKPGTTITVRGFVTDKAANRGQDQNQIQIARKRARQPDISDYTQPVAKSNRLPSFNNQPSVAQNNNESGILTPDPFATASRNNNSTQGGTSSDSSTFGSRGNVESSTVSSNSNRQPSIAQGRYSADTEKSSAPKFPNGARVVKNREFDIGYKVDDVGPSGIGDIEFFITQDGGQKWWRYGDDKDKQTPFHVRVPKDGFYGFSMRVRSGVGLVEPPPQPGDKPDIVVAVDQTPPMVQLLKPQQGTGSSLNKILLRWKIEDEYPASKSISLAYSANPNGPWEPITNWSEDQGSFIWSVIAGMPSKVYVQLSVRDAAGNIARVQTPQPILVDLSRPTARIIDIESSGNSGFER